MPQLINVPRSALVIHSEQNTRRHMDPDRLEELVRSIKSKGLTTAVTVRPLVEDPERFELVAGHRRVTALDAIHGAAEFEVPAVIVEGNRTVTGLIENLIREDINLVDEALAYQALLEEGLTDIGIAEEIGVDVRRVRARLELLKLPAQVQAALAEGKLPPSTVKVLTRIARHSPALAIEAAKFCAGKDNLGALLAKRPADILHEIADMSTKDFWAFPGRYQVSELRRMFNLAGVGDEEEVKDVLKRLAAFTTADYEATVQLHGADTFNALKNKGLIPTDPERNHGVIYDAAFLVDAVKQAVYEKEQFRAQQAKFDAERRARTSSVDPTAPEADQKAQKEAETKRRRAAIVRAREDRSLNVGLGSTLQQKANKIKRSDDDVIRLVCLELIAALQLGHVARAGLRLVLEQLQTVESKKLKNGGTRDKVTYLLSVGECEDAAREYIGGAKGADELLQRTVMVLLAAEGALQTAVSESTRQFPGLAKGDAQELRRKLVEPFIVADEHKQRVRTQWDAIDNRKSHEYGFPAIPIDEPAEADSPEAGQPDVPPTAA